MKKKITFVMALCAVICAAAGCSGDTSVAQAFEAAPRTAGSEPVDIHDELSEEDIAELKGWWTREGIFYDGTNLTRISFRSTNDGYEENTWFANGTFGDNRFWSGNVKLTDNGLEGTVKTGIADENFFSEENRGTMEVRIAEKDEYSILLTLSTGEEYYLTMLTELEP